MLGAHERGVRCVEWLSERGALATGGWDASLRVWDPRLAPVRPRAPAPWPQTSCRGERWLTVCLACCGPLSVSQRKLRTDVRADLARRARTARRC